jgi:electron transport complex protein RnfE
MEKSLWHDFVKGIFEENPLLRAMIGLCAALAVSTKFENTLFMGGAVIFVLFFSNVVVSLIKKYVPEQTRIPIFIVVIASFVTIADLSMQAYFRAAYKRLGVWVPLIVVNCLILARAEAFASKYSLKRSIFDGLGMGVGYTLAIMLAGLIRELFGTGKIVLFEKEVISLSSYFDPPRILIMFPGAFLVFAFLIAIMEALRKEG